MSKVLSEPLSSSSSGILFMIGASALVAGMSLVAKALGVEGPDVDGLNPFQISAGRFICALITLIIVMAWLPSPRPRLTDAPWRWHILRSICGWLGVTCMFAAVAKMPMAEAVAISFLSPLVTLISAVLLMGESLTWRKVAAAALAVSGAFMILRPGKEAFQPVGLIALASAALMGLEMLIIKD